jgi:uncharacterized Zn-binding protein involved in type VI secretion
MPAVTRKDVDETVGTCDVGDDCCAHGRNGINTEGSPNVFINNHAVHRLTDHGDCRCPHGGIYESVEGSPDVFVNNLKVTRIGDETICIKCGKSGNHSTGSPNVFANGK